MRGIKFGKAEFITGAEKTKWSESRTEEAH
ncbi:hypothetical protein BH10BDE1_BH10BDE1_21160 [soil metagenome]